MRDVPLLLAQTEQKIDNECNDAEEETQDDGHDGVVMTFLGKYITTIDAKHPNNKSYNIRNHSVKIESG